MSSQILAHNNPKSLLPMFPVYLLGKIPLKMYIIIILIHKLQKFTFQKLRSYCLMTGSCKGILSTKLNRNEKHTKKLCSYWYSKIFLSVLLCHFIKLKPIISGEWTSIAVYWFQIIVLGVKMAFLKKYFFKFLFLFLVFLQFTFILLQNALRHKCIRVLTPRV